MRKRKMTEQLSRMIRKICSSKGESITETLVALLISALALVMLAGMIAGSVRITQKSREAYSEYMDAMNEVETRSGTPVEGTATFKNGNEAVAIADGVGASIDMEYFVNTSEGNIAAYRSAGN